MSKNKIEKEIIQLINQDLDKQLTNQIFISAIQNNDTNILNLLNRSKHQKYIFGKKSQNLLNNEIQLQLCSTANNKMLEFINKQNIKLESNKILEKDSGNYCQHLAAKYGNIQVLTNIYKKDKNIMNIQNNYLETPLHVALKQGTNNIVQTIKFLSEKTDMTLLDHEFNQPHRVNIAHMPCFARIANLLNTQYKLQTKSYN